MFATISAIYDESRAVQGDSQILSIFICVPPVKSRPGLRGDRIEGFNKLAKRPVRLSKTAKPDKNQTVRRRRQSWIRFLSEFNKVVVLTIDYAKVDGSCF